MLNPDKSINQKSFISYDEFLQTFYTKRFFEITLVDSFPAPEENDVLRDGKRIKQRRIGVTYDQRAEYFFVDFSEDVRIGDLIEVYVIRRMVHMGNGIQKVKGENERR